ncbi:MAG: hypothetical protein OEY38_12625 [Gammaproteobacteria bacterium]|nr:hypothetical protein [Gammaproteobacteria bacterium]
MNCPYTQNRLDDYIDGYLNPIEALQISQHLGFCDHCKSLLKQHMSLRNSLLHLPVETPTSEFHNRVLQHVLKQQQPLHNWALSGLAAVLIFSLVLNFILWPSTNIQPSYLQFETKRQRFVNVVVDAPRQIDRVTIHVSLPKNTFLVGFPDQRHISWQSQLHAGKNLLALPVIAHKETQGIIVAEVQYANFSKTIHVPIRVLNQLNTSVTTQAL